MQRLPVMGTDTLINVGADLSDAPSGRLGGVTPRAGEDLLEVPPPSVIVPNIPKT